jgi:hypothetical protein
VDEVESNAETYNPTMEQLHAWAYYTSQDDEADDRHRILFLLLEWLRHGTVAPSLPSGSREGDVVMDRIVLRADFSDRGLDEVVVARHVATSVLPTLDDIIAEGNRFPQEVALARSLKVPLGAVCKYESPSGESVPDYLPWRKGYKRIEDVLASKRRFAQLTKRGALAFMATDVRGRGLNQSPRWNMWQEPHSGVVCVQYIRDLRD